MGGGTEQVAGAGGGGPGSSSSTTTTTTTEASSSSGSGAGRSSTRTREQRPRSVVEDQGVYSSTCGYCKASSRSSVAHGIWAYSLTVQDYQDLLDRGWRRSGMFLYKPHMKRTCCPPYTIRLKAESFVATKDQTRVLRRMQRYLDGKVNGLRSVGELQKEKNGTSERGKGLPSDNHLASVSDRNLSICESLPVHIHPAGEENVLQPSVTKEEEVLARLKAAIEATLKSCAESGALPLMFDVPAVPVKRVPEKLKGKLKNIEGEVDYTSSIAFAVTALLKRRSKSEIEDDDIMKEQKVTMTELKPQEIAEMLVGKMSELIDPREFTVKAINGHLNFALPGSNISISKPLTKRARVCQADNEKKGAGSKKQHLSAVHSTAEPSAVVGQLEVRMNRSSFDAEEFALYKKYQVRVHNDRPEDVKEGSYRRFLVDSPLIFVPPVDTGMTPSCGFGSFHQQYLINGKLVAVGVVDILPHCLSSKYLFWDPDFAFLGLGKYSALQEIKWVQEAQKVCSSLQYYYLGFYIHSCPKMRYKAAYYPSELLCPERFRVWSWLSLHSRDQVRREFVTEVRSGDFSFFEPRSSGSVNFHVLATLKKLKCQGWVSYELAAPFLDKQPYVCLSDITGLPSGAAGSSGPGVASEQETLTTSDLDSDEDDESAMEVEADFSHEEDDEKLDTPLDVLLEKDIPQRVNDMEQLGVIQLYLNGACISFKHLQELALVPRWHLETLVRNLNKYLQVVGPSLASRMAYALS